MKKIPLTQGKFAIVDDEDYDEVIEHKWHAMENSKNRFIASTKIKGKTIHMSRFIMKPIERMDVDHIDHNTLDNRKRNLRVVTNQINLFNQRNRYSSLVGYKGVSYYKNGFLSRITFNNIQCNIGCYKTAIEAALAYDKAAKALHGQYAWLNFPQRLEKKKIRDFISNLNGRFFRVCFKKRTNGKSREMLCRRGVLKYSNGDQMRFDPVHYGLLSVYDIVKKGYRFIPIENIIAIKTNKRSYCVC